MNTNFVKPGQIARTYQRTDVNVIVEQARRGNNCGLVYPTSVGKTYTAFYAMAQFLAKGRTVLLAHTNPLCEQHLRDARAFFDLPEEQINKFTGNVPEKKRPEIWRQSRVIVATPQTIENEMKKGALELAGTSFVVFDEMHMADKKYAYVYIAKQCHAWGVAILGLTASTGRARKIATLEQNYGIKWWIYRSAKDESVQSYVFPQYESRAMVELPKDERRAVVALFAELASEAHSELAAAGLLAKIGVVDLDSPLRFASHNELNHLYPRIMQIADAARNNGDYGKYELVSVCARYMHLAYLLYVVMTEGYGLALKYMKEKIKAKVIAPTKDGRGKVNKAARVLMNDPRLQRAGRILVDFVKRGVLHPKEEKLISVLETHWEQNEQVLIFCNYEEQAERLCRLIKEKGGEARVIAGTKFMKPREQKELLAAFERKEFQFLVATTVVEAGIHVPSIDVVVNYSMPLTGVARIQRGGRAGREHEGQIYYVMMANSSDEGLYWAARNDNKQMQKELAERIARQENTLTEVIAGTPAKPSGLPLTRVKGNAWQLGFNFRNNQPPA